jgi:hypothetical protein
MQFYVNNYKLDFKKEKDTIYVNNHNQLILFSPFNSFYHLTFVIIDKVYILKMYICSVALGNLAQHHCGPCMYKILNLIDRDGNYTRVCGYPTRRVRAQVSFFTCGSDLHPPHELAGAGFIFHPWVTRGIRNFRF